METTGKRILWVDDEIDLLKPHLLFLQARGYHVDAVTNGDDALALMRANSYDLVLLDEQMPGRRGLEVLEVLRRELPHMRVVMVSKSESTTSAGSSTMSPSSWKPLVWSTIRPGRSSSLTWTETLGSASPS